MLCMNMDIIDKIPTNIQILYVDSLHPNPVNTQKDHDIDGIAASISRYGQYKPIVVHKNMVVCGNGTLQAVKALGSDVIKANVLPDDTPSDVVTAIGIIDNQHFSDPDEENLAMLLQSLDSDLPTGWNNEELSELLAGLDTSSFAPVSMDEQPRLDEKSPVICPHCNRNIHDGS